MSKTVAYVDLEEFSQPENISNDDLETSRSAGIAFHLPESIDIIQPISEKDFGNSILTYLDPEESYRHDYNILTRKTSIKDRKSTPAPKSFGKKYNKKQRIRSSSPINNNYSTCNTNDNEIQQKNIENIIGTPKMKFSPRPPIGPCGDNQNKNKYLSIVKESYKINERKALNEINMNITPKKCNYTQKNREIDRDVDEKKIIINSPINDLEEIFGLISTIDSDSLDDDYDDIDLIHNQSQTSLDDNINNICKQINSVDIKIDDSDENYSTDELSDSHSFLNKCQTIQFTLIEDDDDDIQQQV
jgi:hypothetical protein